MSSPNFSSPRGRRTTAIFTKRPVAGQVKTRLCPPLQPAQAARLAEAMLRDMVERLASCESSHLALAYAPADAKAWFAESFPELKDQRAQEGAGLAERMDHFFFVELTGTLDSSAVIVGSDAPLLPVERIQEAHDRLQAGADLVLGPDAGGGYYLIGMTEVHKELFELVEMSTDDMCAQTLQLAGRLGLKAELLESLYDVDLGRDLDRLREDLAALDPTSPNFPPRTAACLEQFSAEEA